MKLYEIIFSATKTTEKVADIISPIFNEKKIRIDLSNPNFEKTYHIPQDAFCIVAMPVYGSRIPTPVNERLKKITANNTNTLILLVYGNRAIGDSLLELKNTLTEQGFKCTSAITAIAKHTIIPNVATNRPDEKDKLELISFAKQIKKRLENNTLPQNITVPGKYPYTPIAKLPLKIKTNKKCIKCGLCAKTCPTKAILPEKPNTTQKDLCITCMRCVYICPKKALNISPILTFLASKIMRKNFITRKKNKLYLK